MTLRDTIEEAVNTAEAGQTEQATPVTTTPVVPVETAPVETAEQKAGRTEGRQRDEHGRLLPGKAQKAEPIQIAAPVVPVKPATPPPSSWKKDHWESWNKIASENPQLADYLNQREGEFAKGVSTYKQEYDSVKPLSDAMQPLLPTLKQYGIDPAQWITNMGNAHHSLVFGTPQQKLQMFAKMAQDYQVPLQALYDPQVQQQFLMQQQIQPPQSQQDVSALIEEKLLTREASRDIQQFESAKDVNGNALYPHYPTVKNTMAQLLEANLAQDLKSAYDKAIRMHDDIWQSEQAAKQAAAQNTVQIAQAKQVSKAKAAAVSPKTATPGAGTPQTTKGIRAALESAVEAHSEGGRV